MLERRDTGMEGSENKGRRNGGKKEDNVFLEGGGVYGHENKPGKVSPNL